MQDSRFEFKPVPYLSFTVTSKTRIKSTWIYRLSIIDMSKYHVYSFYFRYNSMLALHQRLRNHNMYPKKNFPEKSKCCLQKSKKRDTEFQDFFNQFMQLRNESGLNSQLDIDISEEKLTNISIFLDIFGLNETPKEKEFLSFDGFPERMNGNPYDIYESEKRDERILPNIVDSNAPILIKPYTTFQLKIGQKTFEFYEKTRLEKGVMVKFINIA